MTKIDDAFSFVSRGKESFRERLVKLIGGRSVRTAANDWGIPPSTLNNYIHKGTEPSFKVVCLISDKEQVSLNWLAYGEEAASKVDSFSNQVTQPAPDITNELANELLRRASTEDRELLINAICDMGIKGILQRLQQSTRQAENEDNQLNEIDNFVKKLNINESRKDILRLILALAGNEQKDREILQIIKSCGWAESPGSNATTPDQEVNNIGKKSA